VQEDPDGETEADGDHHPARRIAELDPLRSRRHLDGHEAAIDQIQRRGPAVDPPLPAGVECAADDEQAIRGAGDGDLDPPMTLLEAGHRGAGGKLAAHRTLQARHDRRSGATRVDVGQRQGATRHADGLRHEPGRRAKAGVPIDEQLCGLILPDKVRMGVEEASRRLVGSRDRDRTDPEHVQQAGAARIEHGGVKRRE